VASFRVRAMKRTNAPPGRGFFTPHLT
jgi:hypothetical protein